LETHGPLGTLWIGIGLGCFYIALIWINSLLGHILTPMFMLTASHLFGGKRRVPEEAAEEGSQSPEQRTR
jgi:hypothetical protein